jgi:hypothetical protein
MWRHGLNLKGEWAPRPRLGDVDVVGQCQVCQMPQRPSQIATGSVGLAYGKAADTVPLSVTVELTKVGSMASP